MLSANGPKIDVTGKIGDVLTEASLLLYQVCLSVAESRWNMQTWMKSLRRCLRWLGNAL